MSWFAITGLKQLYCNVLQTFSDIGRNIFIQTQQKIYY